MVMAGALEMRTGAKLRLLLQGDEQGRTRAGDGGDEAPLVTQERLLVARASGTPSRVGVPLALVFVRQGRARRRSEREGGSYLWPRYLMQFGGERVRLWLGCLLRRWR